MNVTLSHRETAKNCAGEFFRGSRHRVPACKDGIQWLIQRQTRPASPAGPRWQPLGYCTTRDALERLWRYEVGKVPDAMANLPERIMRRAG